jgi:hypothetical protein
MMPRVLPDLSVEEENVNLGLINNKDSKLWYEVTAGAPVIWTSAEALFVLC